MNLKAKPFHPTAVRLLDGPFKENQERGREYLLALDADRLLHNFRVTAGLPSEAEPLGGWESPDCDVRGHITGHFLSASALMYASTSILPAASSALHCVLSLDAPSNYAVKFNYPPEKLIRAGVHTGVHTGVHKR